MANPLNQLASLRKYRPGMDVSGFLSTEFHQNLKAIEAAFASIGAMGDYVESKISLEEGGTSDPVLFTSSSEPNGDNYVDLSPGDWDLTLTVAVYRNGATLIEPATCWIGGGPGVDPSLRTIGENWDQAQNLTDDVWTLSVPSYRRSISVNTRFYVKLRAAYSVSTPSYYYRLSARRIR